jgi:hypothetical protein
MSSYIICFHILNEFIYTHIVKEFIFTDTLTFVSYEFSLYMNQYIKSNLAIEEAAVIISDDLEVNIKAVLGEEISDVAEASAPADAPAVMAVTPPTTLAAAVSSVVAVAANKEGVSGLIATIL